MKQKDHIREMDKRINRMWDEIEGLRSEIYGDFGLHPRRKRV
jgi:hypothetical protein